MINKVHSIFTIKRIKHGIGEATQYGRAEGADTVVLRVAV